MSRSKAISHFGIRTTQFEAMVSWYTRVLDASVQFRNEWAAFLTFDQEHHRLVIWSDEATEKKSPNASGFEHICFSLSGFDDLASTYSRLKGLEVLPSLPVNHRFTTSLYYRDPEDNEIEFSVDNYADSAIADEFLRSGRIAEILAPPFGDEFDPEELVRLVAAGATRDQLARIGRA